MATYTLNVSIDNAVLALHSKDSLCIARKVSLSWHALDEHSADRFSS